MAVKLTKTYLAKPKDLKKQWFLVDATDKILGRMSTRIAMILMGKHKPTYTAHIDTGDFVIVINAEKVKVSGNKALTKNYQSYSGYGGKRVIPYEVMKAKHPDRIVSEAVRRMLPRTKLGKNMVSKLKVYRGPNHPHASQKPEVLKI